MRIFLILILLVSGGIFYFSEFKADEIAKNFIAEKLTEISNRETFIKNLQIDFLKEKVTLEGIKVKNNDNFPGDLIQLDSIEIAVNLKSLASDTVEIKFVNINGVKFQYKVSILNGKITDNLALINQAINKDDHSGTKVFGQNSKIYEEKEIDKNFIIKVAKIKNAYAQVVSKDLGINTNTKLSDMEFLNVGNTKNANHFKDVFGMILANIVSKVQNDVLNQKIKQKFESKLKDIINKKILGSQNPAADENILEGILKENKDDLLKKFDKLFK